MAPSPTPVLRQDFRMVFLGSEPGVANGQPALGYHFAVYVDSAELDARRVTLHYPAACDTVCGWGGPISDGPPVIVIYLSPTAAGGEQIVGLSLGDGRRADVAFPLGPQSLRSAPLLSTEATARPPTATAGPPSATPEPADAMELRPGALAAVAGFAGIVTDRPSPSDAAIAAGPTSLVLTTNAGIVLITKAGLTLDRRTLAGFFRSVLPEGHGMTDPRPLFDPSSERFFIVAASCDSNQPGQVVRCRRHTWTLAVSRGPSPRSLSASDWHLYGYDGSLEDGVPTESFADFSTLGTSDRHLVITGSREPCPQQGCGFGSSEEFYAKIWLLEKAPLLSGQPSPLLRTFQQIRDPSGGRLMRNVMAVTSYERGDTLYAVSPSTAGCGIVVLGISPATDPPTLRMHAVPTTGCREDVRSAPQAGGPDVDAGGGIKSPPVLRNGSLWITLPGSRTFPTGVVSSVRLIEIDVRAWPDAPRLVTDAVLAEEGTWLFYPALTVGPRGDVAVTMSRARRDEHVSLAYSGRLSSDPHGLFRPLVVVKRGRAVHRSEEPPKPPSTVGRNRYADFAGAASDPEDGSAWLVGEYPTRDCEWGAWVTRLDWTEATARPGGPVPPTASAAPGSCR